MQSAPRMYSFLHRSFIAGGGVESGGVENVGWPSFAPKLFGANLGSALQGPLPLRVLWFSRRTVLYCPHRAIHPGLRSQPWAPQGRKPLGAGAGCAGRSRCKNSGRSVSRARQAGPLLWRTRPGACFLYPVELLEGLSLGPRPAPHRVVRGRGRGHLKHIRARGEPHWPDEPSVAFFSVCAGRFPALLAQ